MGKPPKQPKPSCFSSNTKRHQILNFFFTSSNFFRVFSCTRVPSAGGVMVVALSWGSKADLYQLLSSLNQVPEFGLLLSPIRFYIPLPSFSQLRVAKYGKIFSPLCSSLFAVSPATFPSFSTAYGEHSQHNGFHLANELTSMQPWGSLTLLVPWKIMVLVWDIRVKQTYKLQTIKCLLLSQSYQKATILRTKLSKPQAGTTEHLFASLSSRRFCMAAFAFLTLSWSAGQYAKRLRGTLMLLGNTILCWRSFTFLIQLQVLQAFPYIPAASSESPTFPKILAMAGSNRPYTSDVGSWRWDDYIGSCNNSCEKCLYSVAHTPISSIVSLHNTVAWFLCV